mmetsp:Transcript_25709/g.50346  ORF Transcript_25709/g.50346 Transcript_25709/m.50346 type:complete len:201 (-) Transcript_25709:652-1254(-)
MTSTPPSRNKASIAPVPRVSGSVEHSSPAPPTPSQLSCHSRSAWKAKQASRTTQLLLGCRLAAVKTAVIASGSMAPGGASVTRRPMQWHPRLCKTVSARKPSMASATNRSTLGTTCWSQRSDSRNTQSPSRSSSRMSIMAQKAASTVSWDRSCRCSSWQTNGRPANAADAQNAYLRSRRWARLLRIRCEKMASALQLRRC